jgi:hypothetical protein
MSWTFPRAGKQYGAYARVPICRACGNPFVRPRFNGCCSERCLHYLAIASVPALGDPLYCQRDEPIKCWTCEVSFMSRGLRVCPECYFKARGVAEAADANASPATVTGKDAIGPEAGTATPARHEEGPINDHDPKSRFCHW